MYIYIYLQSTKFQTRITGLRTNGGEKLRESKISIIYTATNSVSVAEEHEYCGATSKIDVRKIIRQINGRSSLKQMWRKRIVSLIRSLLSTRTKHNSNNNTLSDTHVCVQLREDFFIYYFPPAFFQFLSPGLIS